MSIRSIKKLLGFILPIVLSQASMADSPIQCPPASVIQNAVFTEAYANDNNLWLLRSSDFIDNGIEWNILFDTKLENVSTSSQAIEQATAFLKNVTLHEPIFDYNPYVKVAICVYTDGKDNFALQAMNPPYHIPLSKNIFKR